MREAANPAPRLDINERIAACVRALRAERGLSLDALAARCDVSKSMISLVERGESSPTAVVLEKIASGLGVPLARLFEDPRADASPISRASERSTWRDPDSGYLRKNISPPNYPSPIQIVEVVLPAGARVAYDTGPREPPVHQQIWVQQGRIDFTIGKVSYRLEADDCLAVELNATTAFRNPTRRSARYIVVIATDRIARR